jgi:hypothetical protein
MEADKWALLNVEKLQPKQPAIQAKLVQAIRSLREAKEYREQVNNEHRAVKRKETQLNTHMKSLPKQERWTVEYKRHMMEYKKELTKHAQLLKAWEKVAKYDAKDAKAQKYVAGKAYNEMQQDQKCEQGSYLNRKETIYCKNGIKHEHYHGGQFNGISC